MPIYNYYEVQAIKARFASWRPAAEGSPEFNEQWILALCHAATIVVLTFAKRIPAITTMEPFDPFAIKPGKNSWYSISAAGAVARVGGKLRLLETGDEVTAILPLAGPFALYLASLPETYAWTDDAISSLSDEDLDDRGGDLLDEMVRDKQIQSRFPWIAAMNAKPEPAQVAKFKEEFQITDPGDFVSAITGDPLLILTSKWKAIHATRDLLMVHGYIEAATLGNVIAQTACSDGQESLD